jgi:hypothetical protein
MHGQSPHILKAAPQAVPQVPSGPAPAAAPEERAITLPWGQSDHLSSGRFLNISSIRSVTTKPPTTFAVASTTATKERICMKSPG